MFRNAALGGRERLFGQEGGTFTERLQRNKYITHPTNNKVHFGEAVILNKDPKR